ncbi:MAG: ATP synthase F0 subunit B [Acidobacteria bacterium]|nr:ATP synthase F0 subunit B [Acidobacteriota bacterium]
MNRAMRILVFCLFAIAFVALPAFASEGGAEKPENSTLGWIFRIINFAILLSGVLYLLLKKAPAAFRGRAQRIVSAITEAKRVKDEADRQLRDAENKLKRLDQEVEEIRATAKQDAAAEAERIRAMAREEEAKIQRAALAEIDAAERAARMELKATAAHMAVERATAIVTGRMTPEAQAALVRAFVENLGRAS